MAHRHSLYDTDAHFKIDKDSRTVFNATDVDTVLYQGDHNSERFTFELPRMIDGHDMSLCNSVKVHYANIGTTSRETHLDVYEVTDLQVSPDDEAVVICSWLISSNATRYVGFLNFSISFKCVDDNGTVDYAWNTAVHKGVTISETFNHSEYVSNLYSDVLEEWRTRLFENRNDTLVIHVSRDDDGTYYADKTPSEIKQAYEDNYACIMPGLLGGVHLFSEMTVVNGKIAALFTAFDYKRAGGVVQAGIKYNTATVHDDRTVVFRQFSSETPNPWPLTINGTSYNGSEAVDITVEGGGSASKYTQPDWGAEEPVVILPEATYSIAPDSEEPAAMITTPFSLEAGQTYSVSYNGAEYKCVASVFEVGVVIGNLGLIMGYNPSVEPFVIMCIPGEESASMGIYGAMYMLDGSTSATISITKHAIYEIPGNYVDIGSVMRVNLNEAGDAVDKTFMEMYNHIEDGGMVTLVQYVAENNVVARKFFYPSGIIMGIGANGFVGTMEFVNPSDRSSHYINLDGVIDNLD